MATIQDLPEIISRHQVTAFKGAPEPKGTFTQLTGNEDFSEFFDISVRAGEKEIPLEEFKLDWYSRYRRMLEDMGHTHKDVASIIGQSESTVNGFSRSLPRQMRYAVVVWETMQRK